MRKSTLRMTTKAALSSRLLATLLAALLSVPLATHAAGLGKLTVLSVLGQPLRAEVDLSASRDELTSLAARLASPEAFRQAGIEYLPAMAGMRMTVDKRANGQPYLRLTSERSINEPFLDVLVEMNWASGRLVREYTFLLDPPEAQPATPAVATPVTLPEAPLLAPPAPAPAPIATAPAPAPIVTAPAALEPSLPPAQLAAVPVEAAAAKLQPRPRPAEVRPMPAPPAAPAPTRLVKQGDTLGKIAQQNRPDGVSLDQMLVALFRSNEDAFEGGNMNRLKAGKILALPDEAAVKAVDESVATKTVLAQSVDFNAYRRKLAAAAASSSAKAPEVQQQASGKIQPKVEDKVAAAPAGKDKLEISKSQAAKDAKVAAAEKAGAKRMAALEEDVVARDKALTDAKGRIAALEKNIDDLKKLVELKNQNMALLQRQAQQAQAKAETPAVAPAKPETAKAEPPKPAVAKPEAPKPEPAKSELAKPEPAKPELAKAEAAKVEEAKPEEAKPAEAPKPLAPPPAAPAADAKPPVVKPVVPPPPPPGLLDESPELVYGGGGLAALLLAYAAYAVRRRKQAAAGSLRAPTSRKADSAFASNSVIGSTGGQSVDTTNSSLHTDFSQSGMAALDGDEGVDPVAEADVYMAYGRDTQAEEILLEALKTDPTRHTIHLKLLEIYSARKSLKQFENIATDLYSQTGGVGPDWDKAALLVHKIDPENPLYGRRAAELGEPSAASGGEPFGLSEEHSEALFEPEPLAPVQVIEPPRAEEVPISLDFDLDLGAPEAPVAEPVVVPVVAPVAPVAARDDEPASLDFDVVTAGVEAPLEAEVPAQEHSFDLPHMALPETESESESAGADSSTVGAELEFHALAQEALPPLPEVSATTAGEHPDDNALDFDFDLTPAAPEAAPAAPAQAAAQAAARAVPNLDFSAIDLDLDTPVAEPTAPLAAEPAVPPAVATVATVASEEVATKLELAHAYEEMGDKEGARELLEEVIKEGNAEQQEAARVKLAHLG